MLIPAIITIAVPAIVMSSGTIANGVAVRALRVMIAERIAVAVPIPKTMCGAMFVTGLVVGYGASVAGRRSRLKRWKPPAASPNKAHYKTAKVL
jgi:hypothetical protein